MNLRPFVNYLIYEIGIIIVTLAVFWGVNRLKLGTGILVSGYIAGIIIDFPLALKNCRRVEPLPSQINDATHGRVKREKYESSLYQWLFWAFLIHAFLLSQLSSFFNPFKEDNLLLSAYIFVGGILSGVLFTYFLVMITGIVVKRKHDN
jgi:hypothetical protein